MTDRDELHELRQQLSEMAADMTSVRSQLDELQRVDAPDAPVVDIPEAVTRRGWMKAAAAAAVGGTAVALSSSQPAAAASNMQIGSLANADPDHTVADHTGTSGTGLSFLFKTQNGSIGTAAAYPAALGGISGSTNRPSGVFGYSAVTSGAAYGVAGLTSAPLGAGVIGRSDAAIGSGVHGIGGSSGTGVRAEGKNGISATGVDYGVIASGEQGAIFIPPSDPVAPPDRFNSASPGALDTQRTDDTLGTSSLWFCVNGPGVWRKLAGDDTAGSLHPVTPTRVYDSRSALPTPGKLAPGTNRVVSVAAGRDLATGAVTAADFVPATAQAIAYNVTAVGTEGSGFLSVNPGNVTAFAASTVNWSSAGQAIANAGIVSLSFDRIVKVFCGGSGGAHFIIDITGYYL